MKKRFRIIQVGFTDSAGRRFSGADLHRGLRNRGYHSTHFVWYKKLNEHNTYNITNFRYRFILQKLIEKIEKQISIQSILYPFSWLLLKNKKFLFTDIVHYHLINTSYFCYYSLPFLTFKKPSVISFHDPWPMTGHCVHPFDCLNWKTGCGSCPSLETDLPMNQDHTSFMWSVKKWVYDHSALDVIVPSRWMLRLAQQSPIIQNCKLHYIPYGLDTNLFKPSSQQRAKDLLGIPNENIVFAFRGSQISFKGLPILINLFRNLKIKKKFTLIIFDQSGLFNEFKNKHQIIELGWVHDNNKLVGAYNACDIFLMPSQAESFGMMALEAMACGKPVVAFNVTTMPEVLNPPWGGLVAKDQDVLEYAKLVKMLIDYPDRRKAIGTAARKRVIKHYNFKDHLNNHLKVYKEIINRK